MNEEFQKILEKVGLNKAESIVYLALLTLQEAQTGILCKETKIASSNIYHILNSLKDKGLVSYRVQNNIKVFMPAPPETLNEILIEKQKRLEKDREQIHDLISKLKTKKIEEPESNYKYYEGISGIKGMWHEINESMNKEFTMRVYTGKKGSFDRMKGFFDIHHNIRKKKQVKEQMLFSKDEETIAKKRKDKFTEIRFQKLDNEAEWGVWKDLFYIHHYPIKKKPYGLLIKDPVIAKTMEQVFDQVWEKATPK